MKFCKEIDNEAFARFCAIVGEENCYIDAETRLLYGSDWTEDFSFPPAAVVKPANTKEIAELLAYCNAREIPVTPVGGRTGLSGGMLPVYGGVALSLERMNKILELDERNLQIVVQPGVITEEIHTATEAVGLFYPPDPSSKGSCFIGGNVAENAGGARAVKYGVTRDHVLALEVVLADGEIIRTGARTLKNSTGYNLTQLMIGSEGTLGVVTEITLKLQPKPPFSALLLAPFADAGDACEAVSAIFRAKISPSALEFIEREAIDFGQKFLKINRFDLTGVEAHLLIEIDGSEKEDIFRECEKVTEVLQKYNVGEILFADDAQNMDELWRLRRCLGQAVKGTTIYKEEDTVVPRAELAKLLRFIKDLGREYGFYSVCYGHAGDGNLHVNIIKQNLTDKAWKNLLPQAIRKLFTYVKTLGGTISGEHGVGFVQKNYLDIVFSPVEINLMKAIKKVFDPKGILNPGKIFPDEG